MNCELFGIWVGFKIDLSNLGLFLQKEMISYFPKIYIPKNF